MLSPSRGIREKPRLPTNSCSNEVIIACQYPCMPRVHGNRSKALAPKFKSSGLQKGLDKSGGLHKKRNGIRNVLIQSKLSSYSVSRIMNEPNAFIGQVRQPSSIGSRQISNPCLIKIDQRSRSPNNVNKQTHCRIYARTTSAQISVSSPRKTNTFIERLNNKIVNRLQTRPIENQQKIGLKSAAEIGNYPQA